MRACYLPGQDFHQSAEVILEDALFRHVVQVCRLEVNDEVLLLNGKGQRARAKLIEVAKRRAVLKVGELVETAPAFAVLDAVIATPKKEALEQMLKMGTELGLRKIFLLRGAFSQEKIPEAHRLEALVQSAIEQSNNPWPPELVILKDWSSVPWNEYQHVLCFDPSGSFGDELSFKRNDGILTLIGPEGGFSPSELSQFQQLANHSLVKWDTPILRAPTALALAAGWVTARRR